ncbi:MAG: Uma2 family endonuclease [Spirulinaceae cyanobacterium]
MVTTTNTPIISWEKLPVDFPIPDEPVDNIAQVELASALTDSLEVAQLLPENALVIGDYPICAKVNDKTVLKAPDWLYVPKIKATLQEINRSYTPHLDGEIPAVVMEFLSDKEGGEYSVKPTYPPGKWYFYEKVLQVRIYVIFEPKQGLLEVYQLGDTGSYQKQELDSNSRYFLSALNLFLGVWQGKKRNRTGYWLRFWGEEGNLLPWSVEFLEREKARADKLLEQLRKAGIEPEF